MNYCNTNFILAEIKREELKSLLKLFKINHYGNSKNWVVSNQTSSFVKPLNFTNLQTDNNLLTHSLRLFLLKNGF